MAEDPLQVVQTEQSDPPIPPSTTLATPEPEQKVVQQSALVEVVDLGPLAEQRTGRLAAGYSSAIYDVVLVQVSITQFNV